MQAAQQLLTAAVRDILSGPSASPGPFCVADIGSSIGNNSIPELATVVKCLNEQVRAWSYHLHMCAWVCVCKYNVDRDHELLSCCNSNQLWACKLIFACWYLPGRLKGVEHITSLVVQLSAFQFSTILTHKASSPM